MLCRSMSIILVIVNKPKLEIIAYKIDRCLVSIYKGAIFWYLMGVQKFKRANIVFSEDFIIRLRSFKSVKTH